MSTLLLVTLAFACALLDISFAPGATLFGGPEVILLQGQGVAASVILPAIRKAEESKRVATPALQQN